MSVSDTARAGWAATELTHLFEKWPNQNPPPKKTMPELPYERHEDRDRDEQHRDDDPDLRGGEGARDESCPAVG